MVSKHGRLLCASNTFITFRIATNIMTKIIVLPVHGMGVTEMNYAVKLSTNLSKKLGPELWQSAVWTKGSQEGLDIQKDSGNG